MEDVLMFTKRARTKFQDLYFLFCGHSKTYSNHSFGPAVRDCYVIHIILKGNGYYSVDGIKYQLSSGQGFVLIPGETTIYKASDNEPWEYVWIAINGTVIGNYLSNLGINALHRTFEVTNVSEFKSIIYQCLSYEEDTPLNEIKLQKLTYQFLECLSQFLVGVNENSNSNQVSAHVIKALDVINDYYAQNISVNDIARILCIDKSYLSRIFKRDTSCSIKEYINEIRIMTSRDMISTTDLPISKVAEQVGYPTVQAFSKAFKSAIGVSPYQYRKNRIGTQRELS